MELNLFKNIRSFFTNNTSNTENYLQTHDSEGDTIKYSIHKLINNNTSFPVYNPNYIPTREELLYSETNQLGGKIIKGLRQENTLKNNSDNNSTSEMYGGKKNKPSQGDILHQEAVDYLKNDLKLSPLEARAYKALAYRHIKEKNPTATNIERSKLMISLIKSENFLDEFKEKLDETMKIIENIDSEKQKTEKNKK